jgi:hypothetical protein
MFADVVGKAHQEDGRIQGKRKNLTVKFFPKNLWRAYAVYVVGYACPQSLLGGDCTLGTGIRSDTEHGYSPAKRLRSLAKQDGRAAQTCAIETALEPDFSDASDPILKTGYAASFVVLFVS